MQKKRGRPSAASLVTLASPLDAIEVVERAKPPHDLTDEEIEVWVAVTASESADWFTPGTLPLLKQYCRHVVRARHLAEWIERAQTKKNFELADYDRLLKMQQRETAAMCSVATKMRITQQSTTNHRGNKKTSASRKPWEI